MAGMDLGGGKGSRAMNHDIPLIPFIDFLLCLVMFLLVTAVWNHMARLEVSANVPGKDPGSQTEVDEKTLHVSMEGERLFQLKWKQGTTVLNTIDVPRKAVMAQNDVTYPDLANAITSEWRANGMHKTADAKSFDRAVLHTDNSTEFEHVLAVIDAVSAPERPFSMGGERPVMVPAFQVVFATN